MNDIADSLVAAHTVTYLAKQTPTISRHDLCINGRIITIQLIIYIIA